MTRPGFAVGCAAAAVLLSVVACGTTKAAGPPDGARSGTAGSGTAPSGTVRSGTVRSGTLPSAAASASAARGAADSGTCPARSAFATRVTGSGHVAWQVRLPTDAQQQGIVLQPIVIGGVAVFAEENAVYAIRVSDGKQLWRRAFSSGIAAEVGAVYGLWQSGGRVVVLTGQVSDGARLTALAPSTGTVRWTLRVPGSGLLGSQAEAGGGTLAVLRPNGVLESVDLASGRVLWSHKSGQSLGPVAIGSVIAAGSDGRVSGYDSRTGRVLWAVKGLAQETEVTAAGGVFLAADNSHGDGLAALNPRTGRIEWRSSAAAVLGAGPAGIALATYTPRRLYLVNPATGRARWSAVTFAGSAGDNLGQFAETPADVLLAEGSATSQADVFRLVVRDAANGRVLWSVPLAGGTAGFNLALLSLPGGRTVVSALATGTGFSINSRLTVRELGTGRPLASVTLPDMVMAPLTVTGTSVLAQSDSLACAFPAVGTAVTKAR